MNLKDVMNSDIDDVFLDVEEFASKHTIDGKEDVICIFDQNKSSTNPNDGVYIVRRHLFVKQLDLGYRPVPEQKICIDGDYFYVVDCIGERLIEVVLEARNS